MRATFKDVLAELARKDSPTVGEPLIVYHDMNLARGECHYTAAVPVTVDNTMGDDKLEAGEIRQGKAFKVVFTGPYRHIGNAWALAMSDMRHLKLKASKRDKPFEHYLNDPDSTVETDLVTEIYIPLR